MELTPSAAHSFSGGPSIIPEEGTVRTCPSVSNASEEEEEEEEEQQPPEEVPSHFLYWGLWPAQHECFLKYSWILVMLAQMCFVWPAYMMSGLDKKRRKKGEAKEEGGKKERKKKKKKKKMVIGTTS